MTENKLAAPSLPEAVNGVLNLGNVQNEFIQVIIRPYAKIDRGDKITVLFNSVNDQNDFLRYAYVSDPDDFPPKGIAIKIQPLSAFSNDQFNVSYVVESRAANLSSSKPLSITIKNAPGAEADVQYHQAAYGGFYLKGLIDSWIVPLDYAISQNSDVLISMLGDLPAPLGGGALQDDGAVLTLSQRTQAVGELKPVGTMTYTAKQWVFALSGSGVALKKGDELSLALKSDANLSVTVTI
ncbi:hypothetical protein [Pseudomonas fluorescens]|uniref:Uncharacterized protein n=1 Tax=Pseudomonas fluorescens TaxID=294 RepID=A0A5E7QGZ5_PSEFL|nr:hypothetical protein [Pseudomonas fluorescens]VVN46445.1 hypothetical protein PS655_05869 [Pseudomonas fluorescens]VVP61084.1 hypothetical protein PS870_06251 [Pseudomonas fluorescens]